MEIKTAIEALEALAHETRLEVFRLLVRAGRGGLPAGAIATQTGVLQNTLSSHLAKLSHAGLISGRRDGRHVIYQADFGVLGDLLNYLVEDCCQRDTSVCGRLASAVRC